MYPLEGDANEHLDYINREDTESRSGRKNIKELRIASKSRHKEKHMFLTFGEPSRGTQEWIAQRFDNETEQSATLAHLTHRDDAALVSVGDENIMLLGGRFDGVTSSSVEVFSCRERQCRPVTPMNVARRCHGACTVGDAVVVCGGDDENENDLESCEVYIEGKWILLPEMNESRYRVAVVSSPDRRVFAIGGYNFENLASVEVLQLSIDFDSRLPPPAAAFWKSLAPMHVCRNGHAAALFHGHLFVVGGSGGRICSSVEMLPIDDKDAEWVLLSVSMIETRKYFSIVVSSQEIFAFGNGKSPGNTVEILHVGQTRNAESKPSNSVIDDVSSAHWKSLSPIGAMKRVCAAFLVPKAQICMESNI